MGAPACSSRLLKGNGVGQDRRSNKDPIQPEAVRLGDEGPVPRAQALAYAACLHARAHACHALCCMRSDEVLSVIVQYLREADLGGAASQLEQQLSERGEKLTAASMCAQP